MTKESFLFSLVIGVGLLCSAGAASKDAFTPYHVGPWEQKIGYSQAVLVGNVVYISGTVGSSDGRPADLNSQMKKAYRGIQKTLAQYHIDLAHVVMERIYTTDMQALIASEQTRKNIYGKWLPAATWVEVRRLYQPGDKIEIEVEAVID